MLTIPAQKRKRPSLTPLIDVVFLLLIFFMIVSRLTVEQQIPLSLSPKGSGTIDMPETASISLVLQENGELLIDGRPSSTDGFLKNSTLDKQRPITLSLGENVTFQQTISFLEASKLAGFTSVKLSTDGVSQ